MRIYVIFYKDVTDRNFPFCHPQEKEFLNQMINKINVKFMEKVIKKKFKYHTLKIKHSSNITYHVFPNEKLKKLHVVRTRLLLYFYPNHITLFTVNIFTEKTIFVFFQS